MLAKKKKKKTQGTERRQIVSRSLTRLRHWNRKHIEKEKAIVSTTPLGYISATIISSELAQVHFSPFF